MTGELALDGKDPRTHAQAYAQLGWRVVPIPPGGKRPGIEQWQDQATIDRSLIEQWWTRWPTYGVGLVMGSKSRIFALDVDPRHGGDDSLAQLERTYGKLPATVEAITGGGGRHLLFEWPSLPAGMELRNSAGQLGSGLDIRAEGGQIVVAPSIHPDTFRQYEWEASSRPGEIAIAAPPLWFVRLLARRVVATPPGQVAGTLDGTYAWDAYEKLGNAEAVRILSGAGWHTPTSDRHGVIYMTRPGKEPGQGAGVSIGKLRDGLVYCFTSEAPPLVAEKGYRLPDLLSVIKHAGNRVVTDAALCEMSGLAPTYAFSVEKFRAYIDLQAPPSEMLPATMQEGPVPIDWGMFWTREHTGEDWLVHPILPRGRQVALWARHKTGKSLITLEVAAALATGRPCLSQQAQEPVSVIYLDMEMTEDDLHERLSDMGYGPETDLDNLHYYLLPSLPPLDTHEGGRVLHGLVVAHAATCVVLDTMARVVAGDENNADTYRDFYRCTGMALKAIGVSVLRLDHGGKDATRGQRGSSSKGDDVDVVWQLRPIDGGLQLIRDVSRMAWVPEKVALLRMSDPLRHEVTLGGGVPPGTKDAAIQMTQMGITSTMAQTAAIRTFRAQGGVGDNAVLRKAHTFLRELESRQAGETPDF